MKNQFLYIFFLINVHRKMPLVDLHNRMRRFVLGFRALPFLYVSACKADIRSMKTII